MVWDVVVSGTKKPLVWAATQPQQGCSEEYQPEVTLAISATNSSTSCRVVSKLHIHRTCR